MSRRSYRYITPPKATREGPALSRIELDRRKDRIMQLYIDDVRFFDIDAIRLIGQQLMEANKGGPAKIAVTGLDNVVVNFEFEVGAVLTEHYPTLYLIKSAILRYNTPWHLESPSGSSSEKGYCSLEIMLDMAPVDQEGRCLDQPRIHPQQAVETAFNNMVQTWRTSKDCKQLLHILEQINPQPDIRKVVGFACGTISREGLDSKYFNAPAKQHALLLTLRDAFANMASDTGNLPCYVQDPVYNEVDKSVLGERGMAFLDNPDGFLEVDGASIVVSFAANVPVKEIVLEIAKPVMLIWDGSYASVEEAEKVLAGGETPFSGTDPEGPRVIQCLRDFYDEFDFPNSEGGFERARIYVRRSTLSAVHRSL